MTSAVSQVEEKRLGRYRLLDELGSGGMGVVHRAIIDGPEGFEREVVIKRVKPGVAGDPAFLQSLVGEARLAARLHHPGIVQVFELGEAEGELFLVMEYVDGRDLASLIRKRGRRRGLPLDVTCFAIQEAAAALGYLHGLKGEDGRALEIVHRDISPSNIMLSASGAVKLLDFGIAKAASHLRDEETRSGLMKGKLGYMSPEQADGLPVDARSDIFALGVVMYECLIGERLFRGHDDLHTLRMIREADVAPPSTRRPELDRALDAVVMKMLAANPSRRYQRCEEIVAALRPLTHRLGADASTVRRYMGAPDEPSRAPEEEVEAGAADTVAAHPPPRARPRRARSVALIATGLAALVGGALALRAREQGPATSVATARAVPVPATSPRAAPAEERPDALARATLPPDAVPPRATTVKAAPTVRVTVAGSVGATVWVDGQARGRIPLSIDCPRRGGMREVRVTRTGFVTSVSRLRADQDQVLEAKLTARSRTSSAKAAEIKDPFTGRAR